MQPPYFKLLPYTLLACSFFANSSTAQIVYEHPLTLQTASVIPNVKLNGSNYQIGPMVQNDGVVNSYSITVKGTAYRIDGTDLLLYRLQELRALESMELRSSSSAFGDAVTNAITAPIKGAKALVTAPIESVSGFVSGVGSFFSNLGHAAVGSSSEEEEGVLKTAVGFGVARRSFASKFRIDPYTSFPPVKDKLADLSWASTGGSLAVSAGFSAIPDGVSVVI